MKSITRLFAAFGTLADSVLSLASVVDTVSAKLRLQLAHETEVPALGSPGVEIVDSGANGATETEPPATRRNGKGKVS